MDKRLRETSASLLHYFLFVCANLSASLLTFSPLPPHSAEKSAVQVSVGHAHAAASCQVESGTRSEASRALEEAEPVEGPDGLRLGAQEDGVEAGGQGALVEGPAGFAQTAVLGSGSATVCSWACCIVAIASCGMVVGACLSIHLRFRDQPVVQVVGLATAHRAVMVEVVAPGTADALGPHCNGGWATAVPGNELAMRR